MRAIKNPNTQRRDNNPVQRFRVSRANKKITVVIWECIRKVPNKSTFTDAAAAF